MIRIPFTPDKARHARKAGKFTPCIVCGRAIKRPELATMIDTAYGDTAIMPAEAATIAPMALSGAFPIGDACLVAHPELIPYVIADQAEAI